MTHEEEAMVSAMAEHYNEMCNGRSLGEFIPLPLTWALAESMLYLIARRNGIEPGGSMEVCRAMAEAMSVGIWLAELGKTNMLGSGNGGLQ